jgi:hypothetical protein
MQDKHNLHAQTRVFYHCTSQARARAHAHMGGVAHNRDSHVFARAANTETVAVILRCEGPGPELSIRLRRFLKMALRAHRLRCVRVQDVIDTPTASNTSTGANMTDLIKTLSPPQRTAFVDAGRMLGQVTAGKMKLTPAFERFCRQHLPAKVADGLVVIAVEASNKIGSAK